MCPRKGGPYMQQSSSGRLKPACEFLSYGIHFATILSRAIAAHSRKSSAASQRSQNCQANGKASSYSCQRSLAKEQERRTAETQMKGRIRTSILLARLQTCRLQSWLGLLAFLLSPYCTPEAPKTATPRSRNLQRHHSWRHFWP